MKKPKEGDRIIHHDMMPEERRYVGIVQSVLSAQFTYLTEDGQERFCLYSADWCYEEQQELSL